MGYTVNGNELETDARFGLDKAELTRRAHAIWDPVTSLGTLSLHSTVR